MPSKFTHLLSQEFLRQLSGLNAFHEGNRYFERDLVYGLKEDEDTLTAKVQGMYKYDVKIWTDGSSLRHTCTCPTGYELCKHCVAVGLAWLKETDSDASANGKPVVNPLETIKMYLALQDRASLIEFIMEQVTRDNRLRERLLYRTLRIGTNDLNIDAFRAHIDHAINPDEITDLQDYVDRINEIVLALSDLLTDEYVQEALELTHHTLNALSDVIASLDTTDEKLQVVLYNLQDLHLTVCRAAKPEPRELAKNLFQWRLNPNWDLFYDVMATYAKVLEEEGLQEYRALAEAEWASQPELQPGDEPPERFGRRFRLAYIMETLAKKTGDIEAVVWVRQKDLSQPSSFLGIAKIYEEAGRKDKALEWAERGIKAFDRPDPDLIDYLIEAHKQQGRVFDLEKLREEKMEPQEALR